jgi:hypothetical protein
VDNFQFGDGGRGAGSGDAQGSSNASQQTLKETEEIKYPDEEINPEDIPF